MPKIPDDVVRRVLDRAKIEDVVGDFVTLRKAGVNLTGLCPFHDDRTDGNFIVRPSSISEKNHGNTYRCFVCDKKGGPVQFLMEHERLSFPDAIRWLGKKYNEPVDDIPLNYTPPPPRPIPPPPPALEIPRSYVKRTLDISTWGHVVFRNWFMSLPWDSAQRATAHDTLWQYAVGGWKDGRVVFWQIDCDGTPRAAKLMKYHEDGHRDKAQHPGWIYNQEGCRQQLDPDEHTVLHPLFGAHLLKRYSEADVNIVESEKTALVMANYYGSFDTQLWLACGGLKHLQLEAMQPLVEQGRQVWLWPDKDGIEKWQEVVDKIGSDRVQVYTKYLDACWVEEDGPKADPADIAIRMLHDPTFRPRKLEPTVDRSTDPEEEHGPALPPAPEGVSDDEWREHLDIIKSIGNYQTVYQCADEPFIDEDEFFDPLLHQRREVFRKRYNFKHKPNYE